VKLHLIGVCGTGMGMLAGLLREAGHDVRGSDEHVYPPMSTQLLALGVQVMDGYAAGNLAWGPDQVVVGNACRRDHVEVVAAQAAGLPLTSFPAVLEELFLASRVPLVVAGTHGKTTTSALCATVLVEAGRDPGYLIGGVPLNLPGGCHAGAEGAPFVVEGDEYDTAFFDKGSKFFHYRPSVAILTSVELDHVDIFESLDAVKAAFRKFVGLIPESGLLVVCADSPGAIDCARAARCRVERYRVAAEGETASDSTPSEWIARVTGQRAGRTLFRVERRVAGGPATLFGDFEFGLAGAHNLENAVAVIAATASLGLTAAAIADGMRRFVGVRRRQEVRGVAQGVTVVDDFAHHPTAVKATLLALRGRFGSGRLIALFEPRSATSRRAVFQKDYVDALAVADEVIIAGVHLPDKAPEGDRFDPEQLALDIRHRGVPARAMSDVSAIVDHVAARAAPGDTVVVMSSGGFAAVHDRILDKLGLAVTESRAADLPALKAVLEGASLGYPDLAAHLPDVLVLRDAGQVVGCVALELFGDAALLRSLSVVPERRGEGLGWMLADAALNRARQRGAHTVYLATAYFADFFAEKFGFAAIDRGSIAAAVLTSSQFGGPLAHETTTMKLDLA
jgi:UDP-N-acetylmuramate: L-alanyl-gamma-D-glutamyl-meso-diaminopimelate ligase